MGNCAEIFDQLSVCHANPIVGNREDAVLGIWFEMDLQWGIIFDGVICQRDKTKLIERI